MNPHETDRRHFERQIAYARPIIVLLALIALLQQPASLHAKRSISFLIGVSCAVTLRRAVRKNRPQPLLAPAAVLRPGRAWATS